MTTLGLGPAFAYWIGWGCIALIVATLFLTALWYADARKGR